MKTSEIINENQIIELLQRTLNEIDERLINHGMRVAYIISKMLQVDGSYSKMEQQEICITALLHDIGAYKTEEIDEMVKFESKNIWEHSIYGYLFLNVFSPLKRWSKAVLFHHADVAHLQNLSGDSLKVAQMLFLADRVDTFFKEEGNCLNGLENYLLQLKESGFSMEIINLFEKVNDKDNLFVILNSEITFKDVVPNISLTDEQIEEYLKLIAYSIDFRSEYTVTHTITTTQIAYLVGKQFKLNEDVLNHIYYGALMHDLGKIAVPVEILEYPGKLDSQAMQVMRSHVELTEKILANSIDEKTSRIAVRHHEKLDGSGYPRKLKADELTLEERIVIVSDIVSALIGSRSYKESYTKEKTISILQEQARNNLIDRQVVEVIIAAFDEIMEDLQRECEPIIHSYQDMTQDYLLIKNLLQQS